MARLFDDAQSEYLKVEQAVKAGVPFIVSIWVKRDADIECVPFCIVDKDVDNHSFAIQLLTSGENNFVRAWSNAGGYGIATTSTSTVDNVWQHICALWVTDTDRRVLLNNAGKGTNATNITPAGMDRTCVGYWGRNNPVHYFSGNVAEVAVWNLSAYPGATPSDKADYFEANILPDLAAAVTPDSFQTGLLSYWPLRDDDLDYEDGFDLTAYNTPSWDTHIDVINYCGGLVEAQSTVTGILKSIQQLSGSLGAQSALSGNLIETITIDLVATASTTIDPYFEFPSGTIEAKVEGVSKGFFTSGVAKNIIVVDGDTIEYICSEWDAITVIDFWNSSVGGSVASWVLPTALEELYLSNTSISGDISGWSDLSLLTVLEMYNSSIDYDNSGGSFEDAQNGLGIEFWSCLLTEAQVDNVLLDLVTSTATNGSLSIDGTNAAPSASGLTSKATLVSRGWTVGTTTAIFGLAGLVAGVSVATGNIFSTQGLTGSLGAQSTADANLQLLGLLSGSLGAQSALTGYIEATESLAGLIEAQSTAAAKLRDLSSLSGTVDAHVTVTGLLNVTRALAGSIAAQSALTGNIQSGYKLMPPEMHEMLIDPYSGGAWLWLVEVKLPGYEILRYARDRVNIVYAGLTYIKNNFDPGLTSLTGDGSLSRTVLKIAQDANYALEDKINATQGGGGGWIKLIRVHEDYLDKFIIELEQDIRILTSSSNTDHIFLQCGIPDPLQKKIPVLRSSSKICPYHVVGKFKGPECQYAGGDPTCTGKYLDCLAKGNSANYGAMLGLDPNTTRV